MKKIVSTVLSIIALLAIIILLLPGIFGSLIQSHYQKNLKVFFSGLHLNVRVLKYQRNWFESSAKLQISSEYNPSMQFVVQQIIHHGPLVITEMHQHVRLIPAIAVIQTTSEHPNTDLQANMIWTWSNIGISHYKARTITLTNQLGKASLSDLFGYIHYNIKHQYLASHGKMAKLILDVHLPAQHNQLFTVLAASNLNFHGNVRHRDGIWYGKNFVTFQSVEGFKNLPSAYHIDKFSISSQLDLDKAKQENQTKQDHSTSASRLHGGLTLQADNISTQNLKLQHAHFRFRFHCDKAALIQWVKSLNTMPNIIASNSVAHPQFAHNLARIMALLAKGIQLNLHLSFITPQGPVLLTSELSTPINQQNNLLLRLMMGTQFKTKLKLPRAWLVQQLTHLYQQKALTIPDSKTPLSPEQAADAEINNWVQQTWLVEDKQDKSMLLMELHYSLGHIILNGTTLTKLPISTLPLHIPTITSPIQKTTPAPVPK